MTHLPPHRSRRARRAALVAATVAALATVATVPPGRAAPSASATGKAAVPRYGGLPCPDPVGHTVTQCRLGVHGTPDLSRRRWARLHHAEVTIGVPVTRLTGNSALGGATEWPLVESLGRPMGRLQYVPETGRFRLYDLAGKRYSVSVIKVRGHGCAASVHQMRTFPLVQIIAPSAPSSGTQAFLDGRALDPASPESKAFTRQLGGGTGCGPAGRPRGRVRPLRDPAVGATAHARLSNGVINTVNEYDAKAPFGGTVYFMTNTTSVRVGGVARGMIRVGTPVATVDRFEHCDPKPAAGGAIPSRCSRSACDPNSDGTLTWRYVAIQTGIPGRPRLYGWIPKRCH